MSEHMVRLAGKAFIRRDDRFLLLREADTRSGEVGKYQIPGGGLEENETVEQAVLREVKEETGLAVELVAPFYVDEWEAEVAGRARRIVAIFYLCNYLAGEVILSGEHDEYAWVRPDELDSYAVSRPVPQLFDQYANFAGKNWGEL